MIAPRHTQPATLPEQGGRRPCRRPAHGATRWWRARTAPYGWCYGTCYPRTHLKPDQVRWELAPEPTGRLL